MKRWSYECRWYRHRLCNGKRRSVRSHKAGPLVPCECPCHGKPAAPDAGQAGEGEKP